MSLLQFSEIVNKSTCQTEEALINWLFDAPIINELN